MNDKHLIKNSTREEREKRVNGAIAISMIDSKEPSKEDKELFQKYIDGEMEISEVLKITLDRYKENNTKIL